MRTLVNIPSSVADLPPGESLTWVLKELVQRANLMGLAGFEVEEMRSIPVGAGGVSEQIEMKCREKQSEAVLIPTSEMAQA